MYSLSTPQVPYAAPWEQALEERLRMLARGRRRVAYYYERANDSTFRYRAYNMVQALTADEDGEIGASYFFRDDLGHIDRIADLADVLVICRSCYEYAIGQLLARFRARGKPVYFDIDDFVFNSDYTHLIMNTLAVETNEVREWREWPHWFQYIAGLGATLRACDGGITTNDFLAARMQEFSGKPVRIVPNFMNREQLALSDRVYEEKRERQFSGDGPIVVGYFSGSPSHNLDFAIIESALVDLLEADERVRLMMVGYIQPGPNLARFADRILRQPFHDFVNLQRLVGSVEFNLMPLQSNAFTDSKSELKYFEAAAVGTVSVASPSHTYAGCIRDGHNGFIARAHEWSRRLSEVISRLTDYPAIATAAREDAVNRYGWKTQRAVIEAALGWSARA
jgi:glycosyltransferase involved in cell wall biosynthesis